MFIFLHKVFLQHICNFFHSSFKYVPVDTSEMEKYGMEIALFKQLDKNVKRNYHKDISRRKVVLMSFLKLV